MIEFDDNYRTFNLKCSYIYIYIILLFYFSYVYPYLTYSIEAWRCAMQTHFHPLFLLQKKIIRHITFSPYLAHTGPLFFNLQLLPLEKIFFSKVGLVMFKCSNNMLPNVISNLYIKNNNEIHSLFTRNSNLLRIPKGTPNFTTISARVLNEIVTKNYHGSTCIHSKIWIFYIQLFISPLIVLYIIFSLGVGRSPIENRNG